MIGKPEKTTNHLVQLRDELASDVMNTTDEEIIEETKDCGVDPETAAQRVAGVLQRAVADFGKKKMAAARAALEKEQHRDKKSAVVDLSRAKGLLERSAKRNPEIQQRLTLAARNGEALSERDMKTLVEDLIDLGILHDDGL